MNAGPEVQFRDRVTVDVDDAGVADVRLIRSDKMNAMDDDMFAALAEAIDWVAARDDVRAVVLSGEGRAFCAGLDMANFSRTSRIGPPNTARGWTSDPRGRGRTRCPG